MFTIFMAIYFVIIFTITSPILVICYFLKKKSPLKCQALATKGAKLWAKGCLIVGGVRVKTVGLSNIPDEAVLFVANHKSLYDIPVFYANVPKEVGFVAKSEMKRIPFMRLWMSNIGCLFLDRTNIRSGLKTILQGIDYIKNGGSLIICPEGTRSHNKQLGEFKEGSFKLAEKSGCPIVPTAFIGTDDLFENCKFGNKPGKCTLAFGEPIYIDKLDDKNKKFLGKYVHNEVQKLINENIQ